MPNIMPLSRRTTGLTIASIFVLAFALATASAGGDNSWDFRAATTKQQAQAQAQAGLGSTDFGDAPAKKDAQKVQAMFQDWADTYGMTFASNQDQQKALKNFRNNLKQIRDINLDPTATWWASGNPYTHLSHDDFAATYLMAPGSADAGVGAVDPWVPPTPSRKLLQAAPEVNWVTAGKVTAIRNQGGCGSCWAFAATAAIESMYLIKVGGNLSALHLSEQQLVSCIYSNGCNGGSSATAMNYVYSNNQTTAALYPYTSGSSGLGGACNSSIISTLVAGQEVKSTSGAKGVTPKVESAFQLAVQAQPTVIYFNATSGWQHYVSGIFNATKDGCTASINHAMVAVGYSTSTSAGRYFIIRNSWGTGWGEQGYARVLMTGDGVGPCGMYQYGYIPASSFNSSALTGV